MRCQLSVNHMVLPNAQNHCPKTICLSVCQFVSPWTCLSLCELVCVCLPMSWFVPEEKMIIHLRHIKLCCLLLLFCFVLFFCYFLLLLFFVVFVFVCLFVFCLFVCLSVCLFVCLVVCVLKTRSYCRQPSSAHPWLRG